MLAAKSRIAKNYTKDGSHLTMHQTIGLTDYYP